MPGEQEHQYPCKEETSVGESGAGESGRTTDFYVTPNGEVVPAAGISRADPGTLPVTHCGAAESGDEHFDGCDNDFSAAHADRRLVWNEFSKYAGVWVEICVSGSYNSEYLSDHFGNYLF